MCSFFPPIPARRTLHKIQRRPLDHFMGKQSVGIGSIWTPTNLVALMDASCSVVVSLELGQVGILHLLELYI